MPDFISGLQLNRMFFEEAVRPILDSNFPGLLYSAALIGYGSDVLGYDSPRSTDHEWGPRLLLFLRDEDHSALNASISDALSKNLPTDFRGYSTSFTEPDFNGVRSAESAEPGHVRHHVQFFSLRGFFGLMLGVAPDEPVTTRDWLTMSEQKLLEVTSGAVYHDGLGQLVPIRDQLAYYPHEVWLFLMAAQWVRIGQEEHFIGRCGEHGDDLGSRMLAARLVRDLMRLCFMMEQHYAPYSKWLGTAFARLQCGPRLSPIFADVLSAGSWQERERHMSTAYEIVAAMHNALGITQPLATGVRRFYDRPYMVLGAGRFAKAIMDTIRDDDIRKICADCGPIGSINQFIDNTNVLMRADLLTRIKAIFG